MQEPSDALLIKARKFTVIRRTFTGRDGKAHSNEFVQHPGAAVILPVLDDGRIVMIRNRRPVIGATLLELPAGTLDGVEAPEKAAARELTEETGYTAGKLAPLVSFYSTPGFCDEHMHAFLATELRAGQASPEPTEDIELAILAYEVVIAAARSGEIRDAKSLLTVLFYDRFLRAGGHAR